MQQIIIKAFLSIQLISVLAYSECAVTVWLHPAEAVAAGAAWRLSNGGWNETGEQAIVSATQLLNFREIEGWREPDRWLLKDTQGSSTVVVWYTREVTQLDSLALQVEALLDGTPSGKVMLTARDGGAHEYVPFEDVLVTDGNRISSSDAQWRAMEWDTQPLDRIMQWHLIVQNPLGKELSLSWDALRMPNGSKVFLLEEEGDVWRELTENGKIPLGTEDVCQLFLQVRLPNVQEEVLELWPGWNAVSLKVEPAPVTLTKILSLKPLVYESASRCYVLADSLSANQPFWVFVREGLALPLVGYLPRYKAEEAEADWMFVAVEEETAVPEAMVALEWDGGRYRQAQIMIPGRAYWLVFRESYSPISGKDDGNGAQ